MPLKFPEVLTSKNRELAISRSHSWGALDTTTELKAHAQVYDRATSIWQALKEAGMDAWLNPSVQVDSTRAPQYQLKRGAGEISRGKERFHTLELLTKINHKNFYIAEVSLVDFLNEKGFHSEKGVSLRPDEIGEPQQIALSSKTEAFQFIDGVLEGLEKQAIDLGVLAASSEAEVSPVAA